MAETAYILSEQSKRDIMELARVVREIGGAKALQQAVRNADKPGSPFRFARIVAATATATEDANSNPVRWTYEIQEVVKNAAGYTGWVDLEKGYTTTTAYNFAEYGNDGTGRQMNGIDHDGADYPATFAMQSIQVGAIVMFVYVPVSATITEAWFWPPGYNGEDGTCS